MPARTLLRLFLLRIPYLATLGTEQPTRFRNKSNENSEEVVDTPLPKWEFCCDYLLYILYI